MNECGHCGDRYPDADVHNCWVLAKTWSQENLPAEAPSDYAQLGRAVETDSDWYANHAHGD